MQPTINSDDTVGDFVSVAEIRPTRWYDAFPGHFIGLDSDRDRIRLVLGSLRSWKPSVKLKITGIKGTLTEQTTDDANTISLPEGELEEVHLVTDHDDDSGYNGSLAASDDVDYDTTHLSSLRAKAVFELHGIGDNPIPIEFPVMGPSGSVKISIYVLGEDASLSPADLSEVMKDYYIARQVYAQIGVNLELLNIGGMPLAPEILPLLADKDLRSDVDGIAGPTDYEYLLQSLPEVGNAKVIPVYYVRTTIDKKVVTQADGTVVTHFTNGITLPWTASESAAPWAGVSVVSLKTRTGLTLAHELGHSLGIIGHENPESFWLLMKNFGTIYAGSYRDSKRFTPDQEKIIKNAASKFYVPLP